MRPVLASFGDGPMGTGVAFLVSLPLMLIPVGVLAWMQMGFRFATAQVEHALTPLVIASVSLALPGWSNARAPVTWSELALSPGEVHHVCDWRVMGRGMDTAWTCWDVAPLRDAGGKVAAWACAKDTLGSASAARAGWLQPRPGEALMTALELLQASEPGPPSWKGRCVELSAEGPSGAWSTWALLAPLAVLEIGLAGVALTAPGPRTGGDFNGVP